MAIITKDLSKYRPCVGIMLIHPETRKIFVAQRSDQKTHVGAWQMPQGGIDAGESPEDALWREMQEEIGTTKATIIGQTDDWITYDLPTELQGRMWGGEYIGQKQIWFACEFTGQDDDIDIFADDTPEFTQWKWATGAEALDLIVPFKYDMYKVLLKRFEELIT